MMLVRDRERCSSARTRKRGLLSAVHLVTLLAASSVFAVTPAAAQVLPQAPEFPELDENGVDGQSGALSITEKPDIRIGGDSVGALEFVRFFSNNYWRNTYSSTLDMSRDSNGLVSGFATFGNTSDSFDDAAIASTRNGSVVSFNPTYPGSEAYGLKNGQTISFSATYVSQVISDPYPGTGSRSNVVAMADKVTFPNGVVWTLNNKIVPKPNGTNAIRIQSVTSNTGFQIKFFYESNLLSFQQGYVSGDWFKITRIVGVNNAYEYCNPTADSCTFSQSWPEATYSSTYSNSVGTSFATNAAGEQSRYTQYLNATAPGYLKIKTPGSSTDNISYTITPTPYSQWPCDPSSGLSPCFYPGYKVSSVSLDGKTTSYGYNYSSGAHELTISRTSPVGNQVNFVSSIYARGVVRVSQVVNSVLRTMTMNRDIWGRNVSTYSPEGNGWVYTYDAGTQGNIIKTTVKAKSGSGLADLVEDRTYGPCAQPTTVKDPRLNTTTFEYDAAHCGKTKEIGPAVSGVSPAKKYTYTAKYAYYKNSSGNYVQASTPVNLVTQEVSCKTSTLNLTNGTCSAGTADRITMVYDYGPNSGPNNLLLRGIAVTADGQTLRTCYGYDSWGRKISETAPNANLTSCP